MASILPTDAELARLTDIASIRAWTALPEAVWDAVSATLGTVPNLRIFASVPVEVIRAVGQSVRIPLPLISGARPDPPDRALSAVEIIQVALMWRIARLAYQLPDVNPLVEQAAGVSTTPVAATTASPAKKVKVANHADQLDDTELELISTEDLDQCYRNFKEVTGSDPQPEADPSAEQITVMKSKVVIRGESPYADFSVLTPFGRRVQKQMKARNFLLQPGGSWKTFEIPGPPSFEAWKACWRVYRTILLMLKYEPNAAGISYPVINVAALEEYLDKISELHQEFPECWHLVLQAEDRCRGEQFERVRRDLIRARVEGRLPMNVDFNPDQPWVGVFVYMARNADYWNRHVVRPAQTFLARGGTGRVMSRESTHATLGVVQAIGNKDAVAPPPPGAGLSKSARRRQKEKDRWEKLRSEEQRLRSRSLHDNRWNAGGGKGGAKGSGSSGAGHPRKSGKEFQTNREGVQICFIFAKGQAGSCSEPCPNQRAHCCQFCLGPHPNVQCPKKDKDSGGGGKGK